jgi:hypothetical protein
MWYKDKLPLIIVFAMGLIAFVHEFVPHPISADLRESVTTWFKIVGGFGLFIGAYSLLHMHITRIRRRQAGWAYSSFVFIGAAVTIAAGMWNGGYGPLATSPDTDPGSWFSWIYANIQIPCGATIYSLLAFFIASAAYRSFRAKSFESAMLLLAAVIVMFGRVPVSEMISSKFAQASDFLMSCPNLAAKRGIMLGIALGAIAQSVRILFGLERSYLGSGD